MKGIEKKCTKCNIIKALCSDNYRLFSNGYWSVQCRSCEYSKNKEWYHKNKQKHQQLVKNWKENNPQKAKEIQQKNDKIY